MNELKKALGGFMMPGLSPALTTSRLLHMANPNSVGIFVKL